MSLQTPPRTDPATIPLPPAPPGGPRMAGRWIAVAALAGVLVAIAVVVLATRDRHHSPPVPSVTPTASATTTATPQAMPAFSRYTIGDLSAELPTGSGWSRPRESQPAAGRLFRTTVRGREGAFVLVDFTPKEHASFGLDYDARRPVHQPLFDSAIAYTFSGSPLAGCGDSRCVDYILNRGSAGYAILAGGPDFALAQTIAQHVVRSLKASTPVPTPTRPELAPTTPTATPTEDAASYSDTCTVKAWYSDSASSADFGYIHFKCVDDRRGTTVEEALGSDNFSFRDEQTAAKRTPKREQLVAKLRSQLEAAGWTPVGTIQGGEWYQDRYGR